MPSPRRLFPNHKSDMSCPSLTATTASSDTRDASLRSALEYTDALVNGKPDVNTCALITRQRAWDARIGAEEIRRVNKLHRVEERSEVEEAQVEDVRQDEGSDRKDEIGRADFHRTVSAAEAAQAEGRSFIIIGARSIPEGPGNSHMSNLANEFIGPGGVLPNAHDFIIDRSNFYTGVPIEEWSAQEIRRTEEAQRAVEVREAEQAEKVLEKLATQGTPGAMLNAKERMFAPRCNEDTRRTLRGQVLRWGRASGETQHLLWISGPAGVGKSAVAQTVAEQLKTEGLLGAVYFFSRPNDRSDPDTVIPTIVYQLAQLLPDYRRTIIRRLTADPLILQRSRHSQFEELISCPALFLNSGQYLVIVLDGLDECADTDAQCEFVKIISSHAQMLACGLRFRWIICSRPEPDLRIVFSADHCRAVCIHRQLDVDEGEAREDAWRILVKGFSEIRSRYPDQVTEDWPGKFVIQSLSTRASGHLGFVSFILRFIGDKYYANPSGQLDICLQFLESNNNQEAHNPLHALDLLYTQILSNIPVNILPITQRILGLIVLYGNTGFSAIVHANFLDISRSSFYSSLQRLHSVLFVPPASEANEKPLHIYHASFSDYLKDPSRSKVFALDEGTVHFDIASQGLKWLRFASKSNTESSLVKLSWMPPSALPDLVLDSLSNYSFRHCWRACVRVLHDSAAKLLDSLRVFDFDLPYTEHWGCHVHFKHFIFWLASMGPVHGNPFRLGLGTTPLKSVSKQEILRIVHHDCDDEIDIYKTLKPFGIGRKKSQVPRTIGFRLNETPFLFFISPHSVPSAFQYYIP